MSAVAKADAIGAVAASHVMPARYQQVLIDLLGAGLVAAVADEHGILRFDQTPAGETARGIAELSGRLGRAGWPRSMGGGAL